MTFPNNSATFAFFCATLFFPFHTIFGLLDLGVQWCVHILSPVTIWSTKMSPSSSMNCVVTVLCAILIEGRKPILYIFLQAQIFSNNPVKKCTANFIVWRHLRKDFVKCQVVDQGQRPFTTLRQCLCSEKWRGTLLFFPSFSLQQLTAQHHLRAMFSALGMKVPIYHNNMTA